MRTWSKLFENFLKLTTNAAFNKKETLFIDLTLNPKRQ